MLIIGRRKNPLRRMRTQPLNQKMKRILQEAELKAEEDILEVEDSLEEGGEEVEGTLEAAIDLEAEEGEEEATELGNTEQDGGSNSLHTKTIIKHA